MATHPRPEIITISTNAVLIVRSTSTKQRITLMNSVQPTSAAIPR
uniref:Uncharacterized protein n=1 Tax=Anguilla anguilla TaxID=7936 RepID=A0A0E9RTN9_ANGAN